jgi:hypothetical protein
MTKRWKITAALAVVMMIALASNVTAQQDVLQASDGQSNTNQATAGLFYEDRDHYLTTTNIGNLTKNLIFVNFFTPDFFGLKETSSGGGAPVRYFENNYKNYFDAGTGRFFGSWWAGLGFRYGFENELSTENSNTSAPSVTSTPGDYSNSTITNDYITQNDYDWLLGVSAIFGNKTWAVKNTYSGTIVQFERRGDDTVGATTGGKLHPAYDAANTALTATGANSALNALSATFTGAALSGNNEQTVTANGVTTSTKDEYSIGVISGTQYATLSGVTYSDPIKEDGWSDTLEFGIVLGDLVPVLNSISPWAYVSFGLGYYGDGSYKGFTRSYEVSDSRHHDPQWGSVTQRTNVAYDQLNSYLNLSPGIGLGISLGLDEVFTLEPELHYSADFRAYSNEGVKGTTTITTGDHYLFNGLVNGNPTYIKNNYSRTENNEKRHSTNVIDPAVTLRADFDRVQFAIKWEPKFTFESESNTYSSVTKTTLYTNTGNSWDSSTTTTTVNADNNGTATTEKITTNTWENTFAIGAQLWVKPEKFRVNAGGIFTNTLGEWKTTTTELSSKTSVTTVTKAYDDPTHLDTTTGTRETTSIGTGSYDQDFESKPADHIQASLHLGATVFFNDWVSFDMVVGDRSNPGTNSGEYLSMGWLDVLIPSTFGIQINIRY